jgi:hypothetical protein
MIDDDALLREQLAYYRARAQEYDATAIPGGDGSAAPADTALERDWQWLVQCVRTISHCQTVLELACGTGI